MKKTILLAAATLIISAMTTGCGPQLNGKASELMRELDSAIGETSSSGLSGYALFKSIKAAESRLRAGAERFANEQQLSSEHIEKLHSMTDPTRSKKYREAMETFKDKSVEAIASSKLKHWISGDDVSSLFYLDEQQVSVLNIGEHYTLDDTSKSFHVGGKELYMDNAGGTLTLFTESSRREFTEAGYAQIIAGTFKSDSAWRQFDRRGPKIRVDLTLKMKTNERGTLSVRAAAYGGGHREDYRVRLKSTGGVYKFGLGRVVWPFSYQDGVLTSVGELPSFGHVVMARTPDQSTSFSTVLAR